MTPDAWILCIRCRKHVIRMSQYEHSATCPCGAKVENPYNKEETTNG
jgi:hypothetical protein